MVGNQTCSRSRGRWPTRVPVGENSHAICEQSRSVSLERITKVETKGYDVSSTPLHAPLYNGMAHVVDRSIRKEGITCCVLVAHSKGGLIGKHLLARHNDDGVIQGLVGVNTPFTGVPEAIVDGIRMLTR